MPTTTKGHLADRRREQALYRLRVGVMPASPIVSDYPTPRPNILQSDAELYRSDDWLSEPLHATEDARTQLVAWLMLDKNSPFRTRRGIADEEALEALIPPALFADQVFGDNVVDTDDGQVIGVGGEYGTYRATHPEATVAEFLATKLRGDDVLGWEAGDPQP